MKLHHLLVTSVILACNAGVYAQEGTRDFESKNLSSRTRDDAQAAREDARVHGGFDSRGESYGSFRPGDIGSTRTRTEVLVELEAARRLKSLDTRNYSGVYGGFTPGEIGSTKTREEVLAELAKAHASGARLSTGERTRH